MQHSPDATQNTVGPSHKRGQKPSPVKRTPKKLQHLPPLSLSNIFTRLKPEFPVQRRRRSTKAVPAARRSSPDTTVADSGSSPLEDEESPSASFQATVYENTQAIEPGQASQEPYFPHLLPSHNIYHDAFVDPLVGDQDPSHSQSNFCFASPPVEHYGPSIGVPMVPFPLPDNDNPAFNFNLAQIPGVDQHGHPGDLAELARPSYPYYPMGMERPELYYLYPDPQFSTDGGQFDRSML